jgi:hypothetical protein
MFNNQRRKEKMNEVNEITCRILEKIGKIGTIIVLIFIAILISITSFGKQSVTQLEFPNCESLRECVLMDIFCINQRIDNSFLGYKWDFEQNMDLEKQKEYYIENCLMGEKTT